MTQSLKGLRAVDPLDEFATYQASLPELGRRTGLSVDDDLIQAAALAPGQMQVLQDGPRPLSNLAGIEW